MKAKRIGAALFGLVAAAGLLPAYESASEDAPSLRRQLAIFQGLSPEHQEQIRKFDREFHELPPAEQERLRRAMEAYVAWLEQLPEKNRNQIVGIADPVGQLAAIRSQKTQDWIETLPRARREKYEQAKFGDKPKLIDQWKAEEEQRHDQWKFAQAHWNDPAPTNPREFLPFELPNFNKYLKNLASQLPPGQQRILVDLEAAARKNEPGKAEELFSFLFGANERKPLLPGPPTGPTNFAELPAKVKLAIQTSGKKGLPKKMGLEYAGRWPDYALAIVAFADKNGIALPEPVVKATHRGDMPEEVRKFIDEEIEGKLKNTRYPAELKAAEGKWPDYPKAIMRIARENGLPVPGWTPPKLPNWKKDKKP